MNQKNKTKNKISPKQVSWYGTTAWDFTKGRKTKDKRRPKKAVGTVPTNRKKARR